MSLIKTTSIRSLREIILDYNCNKIACVKILKVQQFNMFSTSSDLKTSSQTKTIDYQSYLNTVGKLRKPSLIREMTKMLATAPPGTIFMAGGLPNPALFPFQSLTVELDSKTKLNLDQTALRAALQYQPTSGYPPLHAELKKLVQHFFNPPKMSDSELIVTVGSQNALCSVLEMILEPGDAVVVPMPVYSSVLSLMDPHRPQYLGVPEDADGMQPHLLKEVLNNWKGKTPKLLYVNPTGSNPSGVVIPSERKRQIYEIARQHNLLILEDDPYYFLHFLDKDPETFLSLDVDGRVLRFDSFSKVLSSGLRVGFATGPKELIRVLELSLQASVLHASSLSQVLVHGILKSWGIHGFVNHTTKVKQFYKRRRDLMVASVEKHLKGLAEWNLPQGGMFLWMRMLHVEDTYEMVMERGIGEKIMLLPGREFMARREDHCPYLRAAFSVIPEDEMDEGMERLKALIKREEGLQRRKQ
ncbi:kynurenine/alpha-aminoadipate aminotransferase, mitochondrial [Folsomia candida]|uniref:kynurenine/alpha-aminoadipate aminotransferase, mitochondrial n=1 Tax=Folsomia candida TaxID=158441 RepID=UPI000B90A2FF|nr:kynurenine/alpha-aminoadipate aminotransferase, mitochondrial [Folsomia candida]